MKLSDLKIKNFNLQILIRPKVFTSYFHYITREISENYHLNLFTVNSSIISIFGIHYEN